MPDSSVKLYDNGYADFASSAEAAVRQETYGEDLGQSSWLTAREWLEFADDAIVSNDAMCHIEGCLAALRDWYRVLRPGGRALFTDAIVLTGIASNEELLRCVHTLSVEQRLSRYAYLAEKPAGSHE